MYLMKITSQQKNWYISQVNLEKLWEKLGNSYTNNYKAVFRRVNGSVLVYFYLDFGSNEVQANNFFKAYYEYDKTGVDRLH